jgi:hypothetical protein
VKSPPGPQAPPLPQQQSDGRVHKDMCLIRHGDPVHRRSQGCGSKNATKHHLRVVKRWRDT